MSDEQKDLSHYMANPDELAALTDAQIDALAGNADQSAREASQPAAAENQGDTSSAATPGDASTAGSEDQARQPDGILSKDGKHVIPYWRLAEAESKAREQAERIAELEAQVKAGGERQDGDGQSTTEVELLSEEELEELESEMPALGKVLRASQAQIRQLNATVETLNKEREAAIQKEAKDVEDQVEAAIAATPKIAYLRDKDEAGWNRAAEIDAMLRGKPEWQGKPFADRFAKVAEVYEAMYGPIPAEASPKQQTTPAATPAPGGNVPLSMSAIPGGSAPITDKAASLIAKGGVGATAHFMGLTPEQIEAELERL